MIRKAICTLVPRPRTDETSSQYQISSFDTKVGILYICLTFSKCAQNTQDYKGAQWFPCRRHFSCSQTVRRNTDELFIQVLSVFQTYRQRASNTQVSKGRDHLCPHTYGSEHSANSLKEHGYLKNAKLGLSLSCERLTLFHDLHVE